MELKNLMSILSTRISYDILDSNTGKLIKWENIDNNKNLFYEKYGNRKVNVIMPLDKDIISYHMLIKLE